jgi:transcriptional regulator with XRE-family HTH domain
VFDLLGHRYFSGLSRTKVKSMSIQKLRLDKGWTQEQLSMHSGLSVRTIQRIEQGKAATLESLKCLAAVFETNVSNLVQEPEMTTTDKPELTMKDRKELEAIEYVQNLKGFHLHWICFVVILPALYVLNIFVTPDELWIGWVAAPWAFGLALHAIILFGQFGVFGAKWEQRQFRKRMSLSD